MDTYYTGYSTPAFVDMPINQKFFLHNLKQLKNRSTRVLYYFGRCADYVLENNENLTSIFVHAPLEKRIKRISENENMKNVSLEKIKEEIQKMDKNRSSYYNYYTSKNGRM
jgi:cytidylate kinase